MLYKSPLIFIKVKCYYAFNEEVIPAFLESTCLCDDLVLTGTLQRGQGFEARSAFFPPCKVLARSTCFSPSGPSPFPSSSGAGHQEADLGRRGQNSCWVSYCCGTGPATLTQLLSAQCCPSCQALGRRGAKLAATLREGMLQLPFKSPPHLLLLLPLPCSPTTESPPNKDFTFCSDVQSQRLSLKLFLTITNI